jgi:hypothetical protein
MGGGKKEQDIQGKVVGTYLGMGMMERHRLKTVSRFQSQETVVTVFVVEWSECEMTEIKYKDWVVYMN